MQTTIFLRCCFAIFLAASSWFPTLSAMAAEPTSRNAKADEISGNWQYLSLPDTLEPKILKTNPWPAQCQWCSYSTTGQLKSIDQLREPCDGVSSAQLERALASVPAVQTWKYDLSPVYNKGVIIVNRSDVKNYMEVWDPQIVTRAFSTGGHDFKEGDLVLYLVDFRQHQMIWIRHLRRMT